MAVKLKPISEQVIVITGASSGIGLTTARMAAKAGAKVVLAARSENALKQLADEINSSGGRAIYVVADVGRESDVANIAQQATQAFGGFDTWVNDAGVSLYGKVEQVPVEDMKRLFETNVWGLVYGSLEALKTLKTRGGALINVGSTLSDRVVPLQGAYSASKHAVKGFTDALRMELEDENAPVSVTLIKPAAIDTPYPHHAKNYMDAEPKHVPPVYAPETVAKAIIHCAQVPTRDVYVGSGAKMNAAMGHQAPRLADKFQEAVYISGSKSQHAPHAREQNALDRPSDALPGALSERGGYEGHTKETSLYTQAKLNPIITGAIVAGAGLVAAALWRESQSKQTPNLASNAERFTSAIDGYTDAARAPEIYPMTTSADVSAIREHMEVVGSDGAHVGTVDHIDGANIKLTRKDYTAGDQHHLLPLGLVSSVGDLVRLNVPGTEAMRQWQVA